MVAAAKTLHSLTKPLRKTSLSSHLVSMDVSYTARAVISHIVFPPQHLRSTVVVSQFRITVLLIILVSECFAYGQASAPNPVADLESLLKRKQYIELERALADDRSILPPQDLAYFTGVVANRILQVSESTDLLEPLLPALMLSNPARAETVLCTLADDYAKDFRYADAARLYSEANSVAEQRGQASECDAGHESSRWEIFSGAPVQRVNNHGAFTVAGKKDELGLFQVPITAANYSGSWIVDSGANLCVISRSVADRLGVAVSSGEDTAQGIGGLSVLVHAGVIPEIRLGQAVLQNVAVLVVDDAELRFSNVGYQIEGSLGIPVLRALGRITFHTDGRVDVGAIDKNLDEEGPSNLFFEKFTPLVVADLGHGNQLFSLDTGAMGTILSAQFLHDDKGPVASGDLINLQLVGAGGVLTAPAYVVHGLLAEFGGQCARLKDTQVLTQSTGFADEFYGNVGQSTLSQFSSFTLDFNTMHFMVIGGIPGGCSH